LLDVSLPEQTITKVLMMQFQGETSHTEATLMYVFLTYMQKPLGKYGSSKAETANMLMKIVVCEGKIHTAGGGGTERSFFFPQKGK